MVWAPQKKYSMKYRNLGATGLLCSEVAFGCMSLGGDDKANARLIHRSRDCGINFFDTADRYNDGQNESSLGKALRGMRQEVILATKVGNVARPGGGMDWDPSQKHILSAIDQSLKRLRTDYIDLYQLHGGTIEDPLDETIEAFEQLQAKGKIRYYGISSIRPNAIRAYAGQSRMSTVMMSYSLLDRKPEESVLSFLEQRGLGMLARGTLAKGLLAGKLAAAFLGHSAEEVDRVLRGLRDGIIPERSLAQTALRFVLAQPVVSCAVVGIRTLAQLEEIARTPDSPKLSGVELETIRSLAPPQRYEQHR
jgi:aryl-alcohol dehydrogenase-like predicted oxidoreductase